MFLSSPEGIPQQEINFNVFKTRLFQSLSYAHISKNLEAYQVCADDIYWGVIVAKKSPQMLPYKMGINTVTPCVDVRGRLQFRHLTARRQEAFENLVYATGLQTSTPSFMVQPKPTTELPNEEAFQPSGLPIEFPDIRQLNWDQHKSNWRAILKESITSMNECVNACTIWQPSLPMKMTPDRQSLTYLFPSDAEFNQTMEKMETAVPAFAIANRSWLSLLPELDVSAVPPSHLCDILSVSVDSNVCLWVIVSESEEQAIQKQIQYMLIVARAIKHQISSHNRLVSNLTIRCRLYSTNTLYNDLIENTLNSSGINSTQDMLYSLFLERSNFEELQRGIAMLLLSRESSITSCVGDAMSVQLSGMQAQTLLERQRVTYVSSPPGTGKTLCGISLYREYGREKAVYICTTKPLLQYLRYNGCDGTLVRSDQDLCDQIELGTFEDKQCVIIDESHHLKCSKHCLGELFRILEENRMYLFVLADNEYQSFDKESQEQIVDYIFELSRKVLKIVPEMKTFTEMFRNTRKVTSFVQHAMVDTEPSVDNLTCANRFDGDGIECVVMQSLLLNDPDNSLVQYLRPLLLPTSSRADARYQVTEVAVLFDSEYPAAFIEQIRNIMQSHLGQRIVTQTSEDFPRVGIVVDRIDTFLGLDAALCIFLLSPTGATPHFTMDNPKYRVFVGSRAIQKAVFVVPKIDADFAQRMKFDHFRVSLKLMLFSTGSFVLVVVEISLYSAIGCANTCLAMVVAQSAIPLICR